MHTESDEEMEIKVVSTIAADISGIEPAVTETSVIDATDMNIVSSSTPDVAVTNTTNDVTVDAVTGGGSTGCCTDASGVSAASGGVEPFRLLLLVFGAPAKRYHCALLALCQ